MLDGELVFDTFATRAARLGGRALLAGFLATLINACVASMLM